VDVTLCRTMDGIASARNVFSLDNMSVSKKEAATDLVEG
jgi:hypothetical protein